MLHYSCKLIGVNSAVSALFMPINLLDVQKHAAEREKDDRKHVNSA
jgi:hypothetical protein